MTVINHWLALCGSPIMLNTHAHNHTHSYCEHSVCLCNAKRVQGSMPIHNFQAPRNDNRRAVNNLAANFKFCTPHAPQQFV